MKATDMHAWPELVPESTRTTFSIQSKKKKPGLLKSLQAPAPPDESTIRRLNELASTPPFCNPHKVKKHDLL
jgi:hypothetical protein